MVGPRSLDTVEPVDLYKATTCRSLASRTCPGERDALRVPRPQRKVNYLLESTVLLTTHRCLPIRRSWVNPSCSYVDNAPL